jgi:hypothetical protein
VRAGVESPRDYLFQRAHTVAAPAMRPIKTLPFQLASRKPVLSTFFAAAHLFFIANAGRFRPLAVGDARGMDQSPALVLPPGPFFSLNI